MNKKSAPFFIEFVGLPGSGKSTLAHRSAEVLRNRGCKVYEPVYNIIEILPKRSHALRKLPYVLHGLIDKNSFEWLRFAKKQRVNWNLVFNWYFLKGVKKKYAKRDAITFYDQGFIQAFWSFILSESSETVRFAKKMLLRDSYRYPGMLVCVEANTEVIKKRLKNRNANYSRVDLGEETVFTIQDALEAFEDTMNTVDQIGEVNTSVVKLVVENNNRADLKRNIDKITTAIRSRVDEKEF